MTQLEASFNLWTEPWITLEQRDGTLAQASIEHTLLHAGEFRAIYDPSPLVIVSIHRLLTAILQDALKPQRPPDLRRLWAVARFPETEVRAFGEQYTHRFDLFSEDVPFLQSADLPLQPEKGDKHWEIAILFFELPTSTFVAHYQHGLSSDHIFCPACAARGLLTVPAFATSGGAGIKPSINGVPPIYILPGGETLFESLAASLTLPSFQPDAASTTEDAVWWRREPVVGYKAIVNEVSYLHSLTFPARRVRLHPKRLDGACTRCGAASDWGVRTMVYQMGESRPKDAPFWQDPFAAYRQRGDKAPIPIRPIEGKALWREFAGLFLPSDEQDRKERTLPPRVLYQLANVRLRQDDSNVYPFRCVGMRTDMKAKVFEWLDAGFDVPLDLVHDPVAADQVREAITFATDCARVIIGTFRQYFGGEGKTKRHETLRRRMVDDYWGALASRFREFVLDAANSQAQDAVLRTWVDHVVAEGSRAFTVYSEMVGSDAGALRKRVEGRKWCDIRLNKKRKDAIE